MKYDFTKYKRICTADFETSTEAWNVEKARVWLWDICTTNFKHINGYSLDTFMDKILNETLPTLYCFRNLTYDGSYILCYLLEHGYKFTNNMEKDMPKKSFSAVISNMGSHYSYCIKSPKGTLSYIMDSLKYVNQSIEASAKTYNLPIKKGTIDYDLYREIGYTPTKEELEYIHNDTEIDMHTIQLNMKVGAIKFTQAGNAKHEFKKSLTKGDYEFLFPELSKETDKYLRKAYYGGYTNYNEKYLNKTLCNLISYDINSMYPAQMLHRPMPYGFPEPFEGKYIHDEKYPIYIQRLRCAFKLKPNGIPTISSKTNFTGINVYAKDSGLDIWTLTLSSPDLELFFENYNVYDIEYLDGFKFQERHGREISPEEVSRLTKDEVIELDGQGSYFYDYIKKWRYIKEYEDKKSPKRDYAKRMMNALYGALATNPVRKSGIPTLINGVLKYETQTTYNEDASLYLPASIFITAWSRYFLIKNIMKAGDSFVYCDTDSLYLKTTKPVDYINVHDSLFGFFKLEHKITLFKIIGCKRYIYWGREPKQKHDSFIVTCCGADMLIKQKMNFNTFVKGNIFEGKKTVKTVKGGKHIALTTYALGKTGR